MESSIAAQSTPALQSTGALIGVDARSSARTPDSAPFNRPIGVRIAL